MTYTQSFHVDAPVARVFDFFRDPNNWAGLESEGVQFEGVRLTKEGLGTHYSWAAMIAGVPIKGSNMFTEFIPNRDNRQGLKLVGRDVNLLIQARWLGHEAHGGESRAFLLAPPTPGALARLGRSEDA